MAIREGAILRQMADSRHLVQLIYSADEKLLDCEYVADAESASRFQQTMVDEFHLLSTLRQESGSGLINSTVTLVESTAQLPAELAQLTDYHRLKKQCRKLHQRIRSVGRYVLDCFAVSGVPGKPLQFFRFRFVYLCCFE